MSDLPSPLHDTPRSTPRQPPSGIDVTRFDGSAIVKSSAPRTTAIDFPSGDHAGEIARFGSAHVAMRRRFEPSRLTIITTDELPL